MKLGLAGALLSLALLPTSGMACYPDPGFDYDDIGSAELSIAITTVLDVSVVSQDRSCWVLRYGNAEYLHGTGPEAFSVTTCAKDVFQIEAMMAEIESLPHLGFTAMTEVVLGVVRQDAQVDGLRYAIPTCWGPLHYNLDTASPEERETLLQMIQEALELRAK